MDESGLVILFALFVVNNSGFFNLILHFAVNNEKKVHFLLKQDCYLSIN